MAVLQTATALSQLGHNVTLVEKSETLGGFTARNSRLYSYVADDYTNAESIVRTRIDKLIAQVNGDKRISIHTATSVKSVQGRLGNFTAAIGSNGTEQKLTAGAIVLSTDAADANTDLTQLIQFTSDIPKRIAIVADILSQQDRTVSAQILSAAEMLAKRFAAEVKLYCSSIRVSTTGLEKLYRRAREAGVVIVKYDSPPEISDVSTKKILRLQEPIIGKEISEEFDLVINVDAPASVNNNEILNLIQGLRHGPHGTLQYDSVWLLPTKTNLQGVFVVGPARNNTELRDAQNDGLAAANQIHELLKNKQIEVLDDAAAVDGDKCVLCLTCMRICPECAISIDLDNKTASVSEVTCRRCGICAAQCPATAIQLPRYTDTQIAADIGIELKTNNSKLKTVVFACEKSAYPAATAAANRATWKQDIRLTRVPCAGKVDSRDVLKALESGAQKVIILACHLENCQYLSGSTQADSKIRQLNDALEKAGVDKKQVLFKQLASVEPTKFLDCIKE
jgi:heterodisulfide reductase subunit A-like polyferredoxin/coenzyme F420-reducing hydrogenase delta subunit